MEGVTRRRTTTGLRLGFSRREITWAHALFVKRAPNPDDLDEQEFFRRCVLQIGIAMASEQFDLAAERLMNAHFQRLLAERGLAIDLAILDAYVRGTVSRSLYAEFTDDYAAVVKHRERLLTR
jgi:hypothetical protein